MVSRLQMAFVVWILFPLSAAWCAESDSVDKEASPKDATVSVSLADGAVRVTVPGNWKPSTARSRIIEREFAIPAAEGDEKPGRLTMMRSGGTVDANVARWVGQFKPVSDKAAKEGPKLTKKQVNGQETVIVDLSGTYLDRQGGGPFAPGKIVEQPGYRMLGGIVQTKTKGKFQYFFKLYGPEKTVGAAEKAFRQMMDSVTSR